MRHRLPPLLVAVAIGVAACSSGGGSSADSSRPWTKLNESRTHYQKAAVADASKVIDQLKATGFACGDFNEYSFQAVLSGYNAGNMPMALGAGTCYTPADPSAPNGGDEEILVEVYGKKPSAQDFVVAKAKYICKRIEKLQKKNGGGAFAGLPFVMAKDRTWVIEPDTDQTTQKIAEALGRPVGNMCDYD